MSNSALETLNNLKHKILCDYLARLVSEGSTNHNTVSLKEEASVNLLLFRLHHDIRLDHNNDLEDEINDFISEVLAVDDLEALATFVEIR